MVSSGPKEPCIIWKSRPLNIKENFEGEKGPPQDMSCGPYTQSDSEGGRIGMVWMAIGVCQMEVTLMPPGKHD